MLIGGWAVGIYGYPRATKDIDFIVGSDSNNLNRLGEALVQFGAPPFDLNQLREPKHVFRMGRSPLQVDIITDADGIEFDVAYERRAFIEVEGLRISVISREDLIAKKSATGRKQDAADVEKLL